jgi:hypothetical protein
MQDQASINMSISLSADLARKIDLLAATMQQTAGPVRRITRSATIRAILEKHLAAAPAPLVPLAPSPVRRTTWTRERRRKPDRS